MFETYGPISLNCNPSELNRDAFAAFWKSAEKLREDIGSARGVYIFVDRKRKTLIPLYVGKTDGTFRGRFKEHLAGKRVEGRYLFNTLAKVVPDARLEIFLLARVTPTTKALIRTKNKNLKSADRLEFLLIKSCLEKNPRLINAKEKRFIEDLRVPGFMNDSEEPRSNSAKALATMLKHK